MFSARGQGRSRALGTLALLLRTFERQAEVRCEVAVELCESSPRGGAARR